tara:strand:- start:22026 stop:22964 length:939 start_codon:yes stop_codon:yes gene_type:complete
LLKSSILKEQTISLNGDQRSLLRYLLYFDLFDHPISRVELENSIEYSSNLSTLVAPLVEANIVIEDSDYFSLRSAVSYQSSRKAEEQIAQNAMPKALSRGKLIYNFPFVKGVYISGSLSKGVLEPDGDVDYFVITEPGRLWLCRSLLILFKKVFLFNSRKFFCLNYFIDSEHLLIEEQNVFTATELLTLIPLFHDGVHDKFRNENKWIVDYYPNQAARGLSRTSSVTRMKKLLESFFSGSIGRILDRFFMNITIKVWKRKFEDFEPPDFDLAMKSRTYVSKHHPQNFQKKVLDAFGKRKLEIEQIHNIDLGL